MLIQMFTYGLNIPYWKINVVVLVCKYKLSACLKFDCLVGSNNSPNHLNSGLVPVQVSQEDVGVVRVLCVWKFIQTALWGFNHLNLATFISSSFSYLLSVIADFQSCCLHRMTFFFFSSSPSFPELSELPPSYYFRDDIRLFCPRHTQPSEDVFLCFILIFDGCDDQGQGCQTKFSSNHN